MSQSLTLTVQLPVLGARSWVVPLPSIAALAAAEKMAGGTVQVVASVRESADGVLFGATADMPWGTETLSHDLPLGGLERAALDKLLSLDGGAFSCSVSLSEN